MKLKHPIGERSEKGRSFLLPKFRIRKECRPMNEYDIAIRETMEMTVTVEAASREEDRRMVEERWKNGEYILDADSFRDVE
ncbi:MAG: DpnD/PcfM family protein, partial [Oscillospiraceae bacterium]